MPKLPPAARTDACGVSDAKSTERLAARRIGSSRIPETEIARLGRGLVPNQARQSRKYDIEMRYCHFNSHTYSQIYDGRARARTADTHAHRTTRTRHNCRTKHEHICGNSAQKRHHQQMQHKILRQGLFLGPHSSKHSPHARVRRAEDMPSTMPPRACEGGKGV